MEIAQKGWKGLARMLGMSVQSAIARKEELQNCGVIFYRWIGNPRRKAVMWFPEVVIKYTMEKGKSREFV